MGGLKGGGGEAVPGLSWDLAVALGGPPWGAAALGGGGGGGARVAELQRALRVVSLDRRDNVGVNREIKGDRGGEGAEGD